MSDHSVFIVERFLRRYDMSVFQTSHSFMFAEDIVFDLILIADVPFVWPMRGKDEVAQYLVALPETYQILQVGERHFFSVGDQVVVLGSERARLLRTDETVQAEWTAHFKMKAGLIKRISMSVQRHTVKSAGRLARPRSCVAQQGQAAAGAAAAAG
jgi:hypothetical protein